MKRKIIILIFLAYLGLINVCFAIEQPPLHLINIIPSNPSLYILKNNTNQSIDFLINTNNKGIAINRKISTCRDHLSANGVCKLMIRFNTSNHMDFVKANLAVSLISGGTIKLPLHFDLTDSIKSKYSLKNSSMVQWQPMGPYGGMVMDVVGAPDHPNTLYTAVYGAGVYKSTDGGQTWSNTNNDLPSLYVEHLLLNQNNLYAVTHSEGIFESTDNGAHWSAANNGLETYPFGINVYDLVADNNILYTNDEGIYRSIDGAAHWESMHFPNGSAQSILANNEIIYIGTYDEGVYKSVDAGKTWTLSNHGLGDVNITNLMKDNEAIYAGGPNLLNKGALYKSIDGGKSWINLSKSFNGNGVANITKQNNTLYAATSHGIFKSEEGQDNWTAIPSNLTDTINKIASIHSSLYAGNYHGIFVSHDNGNHWNSINTGINGSWIKTLFTSSDSSIFAGTASGKLFKSVDNGMNWSEADQGMATDTLGIKQIIGDDTHLYTLTMGGNLYQSTDGGEQWNSVTNLPKNPINKPAYVYTILLKKGTFYLDTDQGLYTSKNYGGSWELFTSQPSYSTMFSMTIVNNTLYLGGDGVSKISLQGHGDWKYLWLPNNVEVVSDLYGFDNGTRDGVLYAGTDRGLYRTEDGGASWQAMNNGLPSNANIQKILIKGNTIFVATSNVGVYVSTDQGQTWQPANSGLNQSNTMSLANTDKFIFVGTTSSVYRSQINKKVSHSG